VSSSIEKLKRSSSKNQEQAKETYLGVNFSTTFDQMARQKVRVMAPRKALLL